MLGTAEAYGGGSAGPQQAGNAANALSPSTSWTVTPSRHTSCAGVRTETHSYREQLDTGTAQAKKKIILASTIRKDNSQAAFQKSSSLSKESAARDKTALY